jgi:hypothetical protein
MTKPLLIFPFLLALISASAFAHDPFEITLTAYLHTNRVELRAVMLRKTIQQVARSQGVHLLDFSIPSEREETMPVLRAQATGLFELKCGTNFLRATKSEAIISEEDHVGFNLVYPTGTNTTLRLDAKLLSHLPTVDPYAVSVTVLDMVNNKVTGQKILDPQNTVMGLQLPAPVSPLKTKPELILP